jgi:tetratricopeptide (TPR) repeat protein
MIDRFSQLMVERTKVADLEIWLFQERRTWGEFYERIAERKGKSVAEAMLSKVEDQLKETPQDERLWWWLGHCHLVVGDLEQAETALQHCLELPRCRGKTRASATYDLACVYARRGQSEECRAKLLESHSIRPLNRQVLTKDQDLKPMLTKKWFKELLRRAQES